MKILCADALAIELFSPLVDAGHEVAIEPDLDAESLPKRLAEWHPEVLVVRSTKVSKDAIEASTALGLVVRAGAGTDNVDKTAASAAGVYVSNVPGKNAIAVAELAMGLLLAIDRHIPAGMADFANGQWNKGRYSKADGIYGKSLAIVGLGEIGFALAERAQAFGMSVSGLRKPGRSDRSLRRIRSAGISLADDLGTLLGAADVVSIHVPKSPDTVGMVDAEFLAQMRDGSILINTSRGEVVDEHALISAMETRGIRAGLDVWPNEPSNKEDEWTSPLASHPLVVGTHHIGASTAQAQSAVAEGTVDVITAYTQGRIENCVNLVSESSGAAILTVRHLDRVGVLAKIFDSLRSAGLNVSQMDNEIFTGGVAAVASINVDAAPSPELLQSLRSDADILDVSAAVLGAK